jgi:hypothetical protein
LRTYTEAVQWLATAHLIPRTACTTWDQVEGRLCGVCTGQLQRGHRPRLVVIQIRTRQILLRRCVMTEPARTLDRHFNYILAAYLASGT